MVYFEDSTSNKNAIKSIEENYIIEPGDILSIKISTLNKLYAKDFLFDNTEIGNAGGYVLDEDGYVKLPQLDKIKLSGLTIPNAEAAIENKLKEYVKDPVAQVRLQNFKVHVLGEVSKPGTIRVSDGKINLIEAISQSGDLTIFAKRDNILVVRTNKDSTKQFGRVDITKRNFFESPFYNLKQGDVVYVEFKKEKLLANDVVQNNRYRDYSLLMAAISTVAILVNIFKR
ncbi:polysaccharide biosynthesis/export family protein [Parasediminibacterium sp. JCM 36343]|uniref:polysaccharide biosynthesis/export family protein n=1 Tax=Parasediminibacterium sp. JCM 36343 TaxID=3374279 RepID=UPI00397B750A